MSKLYVSDAVRIEQLLRRAERAEELARSLAAEVERLQDARPRYWARGDQLRNIRGSGPGLCAISDSPQVGYDIPLLAPASLPLAEVEELHPCRSPYCYDARDSNIFDSCDCTGGGGEVDYE